ncbi:MAG: hypothetical protein ABIU77_09410 [Ferruginibacter sp.]
MKQVISILVIAGMLYACNSNSQTQAIKKAKEIQAVIKPGTVATSPQGYSMKAMIDGKEWIASSMMPPEAAGRVIGYKNDEYIGLPFDIRYWVVGKKIILGDDNVADLSTSDGAGIWGGRKGEMVITKLDENVAEGNFFFTGSSSRSAKTTEVTNGSFRIPLSKK